MKWSAEKIAELRKLAPSGIGSAAIAKRLGTTEGAVGVCAWRRGISIKCSARATPPDELRRRWAFLIGPMKEDLRNIIRGL